MAPALAPTSPAVLGPSGPGQWGVYHVRKVASWKGLHTLVLVEEGVRGRDIWSSKGSGARGWAT